MFRTIERESGGGGPEFLSSHPSPQNRYENINRESRLLRISPNPIKMTAGFERTQARLRNMPRAKTMSEIQKERQNNQGQTPTSSGRYESNVPFPSARMRVFTAGNQIRMNVPNNWQEFPAETEVWFAPQGAFGDQGITHGALLGVYQGRNRNLSSDTQEYVEGILRANSYLRARTNYTQTSLSGRQGYAILLSGTSPVTRRTEEVTVYTTMMRSGHLLYVVTVVPENQSRNYSSAFSNMIRSLRIND
jgi:hypothetical protein